MIITEPKLEQRNAQPYVAIRKRVTMQEIGPVLPPLMGNVFAFLREKNLQPAGAPFWRYLVIDMKDKLEIDVAVPLAQAVTGEGEIIADTLPAGKYLTARHTGHPSQLEQATRELLDWAAAHDIRFDEQDDHWAGRVEWYYSDPATEPDMNKWQTELAFLTK